MPYWLPTLCFPLCYCPFSPRQSTFTSFEWIDLRAYGHKLSLVATIADSKTLPIISLALLTICSMISAIAIIHIKQHFYSKNMFNNRVPSSKTSRWCKWKVFISHLKIQRLKNLDHLVPYQPIVVSHKYLTWRMSMLNSITECWCFYQPIAIVMGLRLISMFENSLNSSMADLLLMNEEERVVVATALEQL